MAAGERLQPCKQPLLPQMNTNSALQDAELQQEVVDGLGAHSPPPNSLTGRCGRSALRTFSTWLLVLAMAAALQVAVVRTLCGCAHQPAPVQWPHFLVVGDWGRGGEYNQSAVAAAMARKTASMRVDFVVITGLTSLQDPAFDRSFREVYSQASLQVPWHAVLGNHDYGESDAPDDPKCGAWNPRCFFSPLHQLDVRLAAPDPRWHCARSYRLSLAGGRVDMFFIDTTPLMHEYEKAPWRHNRGGLAQQSWEGQLRELEAQLARSAAPWKLAVGHHPIRTNHRPWHIYPEMRDRLEPLLIKYGVAAYFNEHDHNLQHLHAPHAGYHQVTSGAGSRVGPAFRGRKHSPFQYGGNGFVAVRLAERSMAVEYLGIDSGEPLFSIQASTPPPGPPYSLGPGAVLVSSPQQGADGTIYATLNNTVQVFATCEVSGSNAETNTANW
ncbi:hypothetical protein ABPG75_010052 [Micractinium tetrahymenae]